MATPISIETRRDMNCYFRSLRMTYNNPLPRLNPTSPYPANTKEELDMRRKAEVLKHQGPQKSTQMNTLTKKQKFAQVIRGYNPEQKAMSSNGFTLEQLNFCDSKSNQTLSSSSDVPGKPIFLYMDKSIPLYKYANEYRTYSDLPRPISENLPWRFFANDQATFIEEGTEINIGTLEILKDVTSDVTTFSINIPGVGISGNEELIIRYANQEISYINNFTYVFALDNTNIHISNINLYTVNGYFYDFFLKKRIGSAQISGDYITLTQV